jgi:hypothetical protein
MEKKWEYNGTVYQLFIDFKKAYDSVRTEVLRYIHTEFELPKEFFWLIKASLNETYSRVRIGKILFGKVSYSEWSETRRFIATVFNHFLEYAIRSVQEKH